MSQMSYEPRTVCDRGLTRAQAGATLIELMIAMLVAAILIGMVFSVYTRLSVGYRAQSQVSELQQSLRAAKMHIEREVRAAGHMIPNGVRVNGYMNPIQPIIVDNNILQTEADFSPDQIQIYYADTAAMAAITGNPSTTTITVDDVDNFAVGDFAVIVNQRALVSEAAEQAPIVAYDACLIYITNLAITPSAADDDTVGFAQTGSPINAQGEPINTDSNLHCTNALDMTRTTSPMLYHFTARAYRISPDVNDRSLGILQMSPTGALIANDWQMIGVGFTNLQLAVRYYESGDPVDRDGDGDSKRDWYSGSMPIPAGAVPFEVSVSLEVRTIYQLDLVPTAATPSFIEPNKNANFNRIGDWDSIQLDSVADASRPLQYRGNHIYRWSTTTIDVRNMGVGR